MSDKLEENFMKLFLVGLMTLTSLSVFASVGKISATTATNRANTLDLKIQGSAAKTISSQLKINGVSFKRDPFSGALVQVGDGVLCISEHVNQLLYCYISITGKAVN
jgi:hypothetical protein